MWLTPPCRMSHVTVTLSELGKRKRKRARDLHVPRLRDIQLPAHTSTQWRLALPQTHHNTPARSQHVAATPRADRTTSPHESTPCHDDQRHATRMWTRSPDWVFSSHHTRPPTPQLRSRTDARTLTAHAQMRVAASPPTDLAAAQRCRPVDNPAAPQAECPVPCAVRLRVSLALRAPPVRWLHIESARTRHRDS